MRSFTLCFEFCHDGLEFTLHHAFGHANRGKEMVESVNKEWKRSMEALYDAIQGEEGMVERLTQGGEVCSEALLKRWFISRQHDIQKTVKALDVHSHWRHTFIPKGHITESEISTELKSGKCFLQGPSNEGHAVLVVLARQHDMNHRDFHQTQKFICYVLDVCSAFADNAGGQKICCLFDLTGLRLKNLDVKVLCAIFELLQQHYPERLGMLWFINAPFIFGAMWKLVCPILEKCSREKIKFVSCQKQSSPAFLRGSISETVLPACYGGQAKLIPIQIAAVRLLPHYHGKFEDNNKPGSKKKKIQMAWSAWYRKHEKISKVGNWIYKVWRKTWNVRWVQSVKQRAQRIFVRPKPLEKILFPQYSRKRQHCMRACFESKAEKFRIKSFLLVVLIVHFSLLALTHVQCISISELLRGL